MCSQKSDPRQIHTYRAEAEPVGEQVTILQTTRIHSIRIPLFQFTTWVFRSFFIAIKAVATNTEEL